ncbi:MAG: chitobiase/beta-hexosaminidase C-terminal domain-containing protein, partial [Spirochaetota bacterium]|nr:chitobiase/beta-hexosaminidase C-terminal domain-containing protein [Spirochaetota bacterium]
IRCDSNDIVFQLKKKYEFLQILTVSPATNGVNIAKNAQISIQFSQPMDPNTFPNSFLLTSDLGNVPLSNYTVTWSNNNTTVTLSSPIALFGNNLIYNLLINTNIRSADGNPMRDNFHSAFTTGNFTDNTSPTIVSHCVKSGVNCVPASGVIYPVDSMEFNFSEPMLPSETEAAFSFTVNGKSVAKTAVWSNYNQTVTFTFSNLPSGSVIYSMSNVAKDANGNVLDPASVISNSNFIVGGGNMVDYVLSNVVHPISGSPGNNFTGSFKISNAGKINGASNISWGVYLSTDTIYNAGDTPVQSGIQPALNGGTSSPTINFDSTVNAVPFPSTPGNYYLIIIINSTDDGNTTNNTYVSSAIQVGLVDYTINTSTYPTGTATAGTPLTGNFTIRNIGGMSGTNPVNYTVYFSSDNLVGTDTPLGPGGTGTTPALTVGSTSPVINFTGNWPIASGTYYLIIIASSGEDTNTTNNVSISPAIIVDSPAYADYTVTNTNFPASGVPNTPFNGSFTIQNIGSAYGLQNVSWNVYLSTDNIYNQGVDTFVQNGTIAPLIPGATSTTISYAGIWPSTSGNYYLIIVVTATDDGNSLNNNFPSTAINSSSGSIATPTFSPGGGIYNASQTVTISAISPVGTTIIYTTNATTPTADINCNATNGLSVPSGSSININSTINLRAIACKVGYTNSSEQSTTYTLQVPTPVISPATGSYPTSQNVTISTSPIVSNIWYTTDGTTPACGGGGTTIQYTGSFVVSSTSTIKAIGCLTGWVNSTESSATFTITGTVGTPTFSVGTGTYNNDQSVTITATNATAIIYTTNNTAPTANSSCVPTNGALLTPGNSVTINTTGIVLRAMGCQAGWTNSAEQTATYTLQVAIPTFSPVAGAYASKQFPTISTSTLSTTIRYTTDGVTNPSQTVGTIYTGAISVPYTTTLRAIAYKTGYLDSAVTSDAIFTITGSDYSVSNFNLTNNYGYTGGIIYYAGDIGGDVMNGSFMVTNSGNNGSGVNWSVDLYDDAAGTTLRSTIATGTTSGISTGASVFVNFSSNIPAGNYPGNRYVKVTINGIDTDYNTANNTLISTAQNIGYLSPPNLTATTGNLLGCLSPNYYYSVSTTAVTGASYYYFYRIVFSGSAPCSLSPITIWTEFDRTFNIFGCTISGTATQFGTSYGTSTCVSSPTASSQNYKARALSGNGAISGDSNIVTQYYN